MRRAAALRLSLLTSLGLVPAACGGVTHDGPLGNEGHGGNSSNAGAAGSAGTPDTASTAGATGGMAATFGGAGASAGTNTMPTAGIGGGGTNGTAGESATHSSQACTDPQVDPVNGLVTCKEGYKHRPQAVVCKPPPGTADPGNLPRAPANLACSADCAKRYAYGYCQPSPIGGPCVSGCLTDTDCGLGSICVCDEAASPTGGACRPTDCVTDSNCSNGLRCASYTAPCGLIGYACQLPEDECVAAGECPLMGTAPATCISRDGHRICFGAPCGRPFLVQAEARLPPIALRADWSTKATPRLGHLTAPERAALSAHWTKLGQMEHASIAAFARFSLQLLSLGAPPELVEACTQALADETKHTQLCFGLASAYAGRAIGPGPLDVASSLDVTSLVDIVDLVIAEGCFGETGAALDAFEAAETAEDPLIASVYAQIASDEQAHAELAFRFVRWALERDRAAVAPRIREALLFETDSPSTLEVVKPCFEALLAITLAA